ncbi:MAG: xanthine dehydrogenase accessory protein XdhC [Rhizobiaceae bacterium]
MEAGRPIMIVNITNVKGSAPRDGDASMFVTPALQAGTIGGGQLEWIAIGHSREMMEKGASADTMDVPLGPEIGQCCGGRVVLGFACVDAAMLAQIEADAISAAEELPQVWIFGAGHTGKALAAAMAGLPMKTWLVDSREEAFSGWDSPVSTIRTAIAEAEVRKARPASAFVTMTHSHSLDFLITAEALARGDGAYVGMIGSATKRAVFASWLRDHDYREALIGELVCPIGGSQVHDKRPEVIAALTAAQILTALHMHRLQSQSSERIS